MALPLASIERIEIFSRWVGFAVPPSVTEKLTIRANGDRFIREVSVEGQTDEVEAELVREFTVALGRPAFPELSSDLFDLPIEVLHKHFGSIWTNDCPALLVRVTDRGGHVVDVRSNNQHTFMLPLKIIDHAAGSADETYDPRLSRSIAALMTESFLHRSRLADRGCTLEWDLARAEEFKHSETSEPDKPAIAPACADKTPQAHQLEDWESIIHRLFSREESPEEKADAERTGNHSQRLLKRIPLGELAALIERGVDPNVADDAGQTALMHAAFPPFDRERFLLLVEAGADLEARRDDGCNGLHLACAGWMTETAVAWITAGANVNSVTPESATALMLGAVSDGIVELLLEYDVNVNAVDDDGHSALAYAILKQSSAPAERVLNSVRTLLAAGANVNLHDKRGLSPIDHARRVLARAELEDETLQAIFESLTAHEVLQRQADQEQQARWLEQHRREHPESELLINPDYDDRTLAAEIVSLVTSAGVRSSGTK